jgi:hypothetical protein
MGRLWRVIENEENIFLNKYELVTLHVVNLIIGVPETFFTPYTFSNLYFSSSFQPAFILQSAVPQLLEASLDFRVQQIGGLSSAQWRMFVVKDRSIRAGSI